MHQHRGLGDAAGALVDVAEAGKGVVDALAVAGRQPEDVLQAPVDERVRHADVDHERRAVLGRGLRGRQCDGARVAADEAGHAFLLHALDFRDADFRPRLRIAQHRLELRATHGPDAAGRVDLVDGPLRAEARLAARIGQRPTHRMQQADLHGLRLSQHQAGRAESDAGSASLEYETTRNTSIRGHRMSFNGLET